MPSVPLFLLAAAALPPAGHVQTGVAKGLFLLVAVVLGVLLVGVIVSLIIRRLMRLPKPNEAPGKLPDPWRESAQRVQPYPAEDEVE